jgi:pyruvate formate lyase activating enzyme
MKILKGGLEPVKKTIKIAYEEGIHTEVTTLIVPKVNDNLDELEEEFSWLASISKDIPLHLSRYFPAFKYNEPPTDISFLEKTYELAKKYLNFVYLGNILSSTYENTYCPDCGTLLIQRKGYDIKIENLNENGECKNCGRKICIV